MPSISTDAAPSGGAGIALDAVSALAAHVDEIKAQIEGHGRKALVAELLAGELQPVFAEVPAEAWHMLKDDAHLRWRRLATGG